MRITHCRARNMAKKTEKRWKMKHKHYLTWNMTRNTKNVENKKCTL